MKRSLLIFALAVVAGFLGRGGWRSLTAEPASTAQPSESTPQIPTPAEPAAPPKDEPAAAPSKSSDRRIITEKETPVMAGETVITEGYFEPILGHFIFHTFTPMIETQDDGKTVVKVKAENFIVSVNGDYKTHKLPLLTVRPNNTFSMNIGTEGVTHHFLVGAKVDPATSMILMTAKTHSYANTLSKPKPKK